MARNISRALLYVLGSVYNALPEGLKERRYQRAPKPGERPCDPRVAAEWINPASGRVPGASVLRIAFSTHRRWVPPAARFFATLSRRAFPEASA